MTKKDFTPTENKDREGAEDWRSHHDETKHFSEDAKGIGEVDVKNAHATGDGSFGRSESSLPEKEEDGPKNDNPY